MSFRTMYKTLSTDNVLQINWIRQWPFPANSSESRRCQLTTKCTLQQHAHIHISPVNSTPPQKKTRGATLSWNHVRRTGTQFSPRGRGQYSPGTQTEGRVANVTKGMRPVRYGQRTLVSVVEPLSGQPRGLSVGKGSSYAATDSYGDESSRQRT